jgi:hypothetical protein
VKLPAQGNLDADDYKSVLKAFCHSGYNSKIQTPLGDRISKNVRREHASGFIVVNFLLHKPVDIKNDPANGDNTVTAANKGFVTWGGSIGLADSVILADQKDPDKVYYVVAHEMGHNFYLLHWENTGENNQSDHDQDDHNCMMSYSDFSFADPGRYAHHEPGVYTPHFCGKCNLALRGWDIVAGGMAAKAVKGFRPAPRKGMLEVTVKDPVGNPIPGAQVELQETGKKVGTSPRGKAAFPDLDTGTTYHVKVRKRAYGPLPAGPAVFAVGDATGESAVQANKSTPLLVRMVAPFALQLSDTPDDATNPDRVYKVRPADTKVLHNITATLKCRQKAGRGAGTQYPVKVEWTVQAAPGNAPKANGGKDNTDVRLEAAPGYAMTGDGKTTAFTTTDDSGKTEINLSASDIAGDRFRLCARVLLDPANPAAGAIVTATTGWYHVWRKLRYGSLYRMETGGNKGVDVVTLCTKNNIQPAYTPAFTDYTCGAAHKIAYREYVGDLVAPTADQLPIHAVVGVTSDGPDTRRVTIAGLVVAGDGSTTNGSETLTLDGTNPVVGATRFQKITGIHMSAADPNRSVEIAAAPSSGAVVPVGVMLPLAAAMPVSEVFDTWAAVQVKAQAWADANLAAVTTALDNLRTSIGAAGYHLVGLAYLHPKEDGRPATGKTTYYAGYPGTRVNVDGNMYDADGEWDGCDGINSGQMSCLFLNVAKTHPIGSPYTLCVARHEIGHASDHEAFGPGDHCPQPSNACLMNANATAVAFCDTAPDKSLHRAMGWKP